MAGALEQFKELIVQTLQELRLSCERVDTYGTPRRLIAIGNQVATNQAPTTKETRGPAKSACFDAQGQPTQAFLGFCRGQGIQPDQAEFRTLGDAEYAFAVKQDAGLPAIEALAKALPDKILSMTFPKTLRWGEGNIRFARPVRWIVALFGNQVIDFEIAGARSGRLSRGHRFARPEEFEAAAPTEFLAQLKTKGVIADPKQREETIQRASKEAAERINGNLLLDDDLLEENVYLTENPQPILCEFDREFLALPRACLVSAMRKHEKFIPIEDRQGRLMPNFVSVTNGGDPDTVKKGNEWVMMARFNDAKFFFEEDRKRNLRDFLPDLERILYQQKLGTIADKVRRMEKIAQQFAQLPQGIAAFCKADLATQMVMEFPDLQGAIGREYALLDGIDPAIAQAIEEHYRPRYSLDVLPDSALGAALAVADKIDALVGYVGLGFMPKGSTDPYGLKRAANGCVELLAAHPDFPVLSQLSQWAYEAYQEQGVELKPFEQLYTDLQSLFYARLDAFLQEIGIRYDIARAVLNGDEAPVNDYIQRAEVLQSFGGPDFEARVQTATRPANILSAALKKGIAIDADLTKVDASLFEHPTERALHESLQSMPKTEDPEELWEALRKLEEPINALFDAVMVMDEDAHKRDNRLTLLACADRLYRRLADFTQIVLEGE